MKLPYFVATLSMVGLLSYITLADAQSKNEAMPPDAKFARMAALSSMTEIETGRLAEKMGDTDGVKKLGAMMVRDHTAAGAKLKAIAAKENITLPTKLEAPQQAMVDELKQESGAAFDKLYVEDMVKGHTLAVALFHQESQDGQNADLKAFATETLPIIEGHLKHAEDLQTEMKK